MTMRRLRSQAPSNIGTRKRALDVLRAACMVFLVGVAAGCSQDAAPPASAGNLRVSVPAPGEMVAQVRAAGVSNASELEVTPLRDPQIGDLLARAAHLEAQSDYPGATQAIAQALTLLPSDPELLQQAAEFALYQKQWPQAAAFAQQSFERGPKLGSLCRRNWTTLRFTRLASGDVAGVQAANQQAAACAVEPPVRM
jgi:tetratricopeptide (TPR) repeat protein